MARVTPVARKLVDAPAERIQTLGGVCLGFLPNTSSMYRSCERESAAVRDRRRRRTAVLAYERTPACSES